MKMSLKVLICDDEVAVAEGWVEQIKNVVSDNGAYEIAPAASQDELEVAFKTLLTRQGNLRDGKSGAAESECIFDDVDILVIDYDLVHIDEEKTRYTGEGIARLARAYSSVGFIVVLNQFPEVQFDLSLQGHIESQADLNMHANLIGTRGLWMKPPWEQGFRPWHWPVLSEAAAACRIRTKFVTENIDLPILEALGFSEKEAARLSDSAFGFIAPEADDLTQLMGVTFRGFVRDNSAATDPKDGNKLVEENVAATARIASSRIAKWLERAVVGPQDVLVDLPHLIQRMPFLIKGDVNELDIWNKSLEIGREILSTDIPKAGCFMADGWLSRPAFWWPVLEDDAVISEKRFEYDYASVPDFVFLEDASRFGRMEEAKEFRAGFHNHLDRRYAYNFDEYRYAPRRRFAL